MPTQRCLNLWSLPYEVLQLPKAERLAVIKKLQKVSGEHGFAPGELSGAAPITAIEELMALGFLSVVMGGPLLLLACGLGCLIVGTWTHCALWTLAALVLAFHPLPDIAEPMSRSRLTLALYKYFSYRWLWDGDNDEAGQAAAPFIGYGPPHGVMPFANVLSIPAINTCTSACFVGVGADVVFHTPFLRYLTLFGCIGASAGSITKALKHNQCPGVVPDGIAGIFRLQAGGTGKCRALVVDEVVFLRSRKGLAKLALRTGRPILPVYSAGNTQAFSAWYDPFGLMERASRAAQAAVFVYWGRGCLPLPRRTPITMLFGRPIFVEAVPDPTVAQVDALHERVMREIKALFDTHKATIGWAHKELRFV